MGLLLGLFLYAVAQLLSPWLPPLLSAGIIVALWLKLTGALHLDGAMDVADAFGVFDTEKRLTVMSDSHSGAFGVITAVMILLLKVSAVSSVVNAFSLWLCVIPVWGRFAHVLAVGQYPYLKKTGKGALHHENFVQFWDYIPGILVHLLILFVFLKLDLFSPFLVFLICFCLAPLTSWSVGRWFYQQFQGMTGDIHGAIVEWTETLLLIEIIGVSKILQTF